MVRRLPERNKKRKRKLQLQSAYSQERNKARMYLLRGPLVRS